MKKMIQKLLFITSLLLVFMTLVACSQKEDVMDGIKEDGYTCTVTFDLCGGLVGNSSTQLYMTKSDSLIPRPGEAKTTEPTMSGYNIAYYYTKEVDENGSVVERIWDFTTDRVTGDMTLYCKWVRNFTVTVYYGEENKETMSVSFSEEKPTVESFREPRWTGYTFLAFYRDAEYTQPVTFPYTHALDPENPDEKIYARYLEGNYTVVRVPSDLKKINAGAMYYLTTDVDMTGITVSTPDTFSGKIIGNGYTIRNMTVTKKQSKNGEYYGLFNRMLGEAQVTDVTFENLTVTVELNNELNTKINYVGTLAGQCGDSVVVSGVTLTDATLQYHCHGRDLASLLILEEVFGEDLRTNQTGIDATVTIQEVTDPA